MCDPFWEALSRLEFIGFKVLALTCDGLAANRRLFTIHDFSSDSNSLLYKVPNPEARDGRYLYFLVDPPHLMKTVRNGWENPKRHLWVGIRINSIDSINNNNIIISVMYSAMVMTFDGHIWKSYTTETGHKQFLDWHWCQNSLMSTSV